MSTDTLPDVDEYDEDDGPAWRSTADDDEGPNYHRYSPDDEPGRGHFDEDGDELDEEIEAAYAAQQEAAGPAAASGPGSFLTWAVGGATVIVTALGTFVLVGPFAALIPVGAGAAAAAAAVRRRSNRRGGGARRRRMQGGGAQGGPGGRGPRGGGRFGGGGGGGGGRGRGRGGSSGGGGGGGRGRAGGGPQGAGGGSGRGRGGSGRPNAGGSGRPGAGGGRPGAGGQQGGAGRRKAMQGTASGPVSKLAKKLTGGGGGPGKGGGRHRAGGGGGGPRGGGGRGGAGPQPGGAGSGPGAKPKKGRKTPKGGGAHQQTPGAPVRRTMRQRAARVGGDFARGLWAIPAYPTRQAYRGARAGARRVWTAKPTRKLRRHTARWYAQQRKKYRKRNRKQTRFYRRTWWPRQVRRVTGPARRLAAWTNRRSRVSRVRMIRQLRRAAAMRRVLGRRLRRVWGARYRRVVAFRPAWWTQLQNYLAVHNGVRGALALLLTAWGHALAAFFRDVLPAWALHGRRARRPAPQPRPQHRPTPQPAPAGPRPQGARPGTHRPARPARPATAGPGPMPRFPRPTATPAPAPVGATTPAGGQPMAATAQQNQIDISVPAGIHPSLVRIAEASYRCTATYRPKSPLDLHVYLESQGAAIKVHADIHRQFGDRLAATFPGVNLVHAFFAQVAHGYTNLQTPAHELFRGWEVLHAADLARFRSPRVNEAYSDVAKHGVTVANVPVIGNGNRWHYNHTIMTEVTRAQLFGLTWGVTDDDKVRELMTWLDGLGLLFDCLARHTISMGRFLLMNMPVEPRLGDFYAQFARGYIHLADQADELALAYRRRNAADTNRRERPRINEAWFDFSNQEVTAAG
jgi:hypothetical protein